MAQPPKIVRLNTGSPTTLPKNLDAGDNDAEAAARRQPTKASLNCADLNKFASDIVGFEQTQQLHPPLTNNVRTTSLDSLRHSARAFKIKAQTDGE